MRINKQFCFKHPSGEDIYLFTLFNDKGTEVIISNFGAIITSFRVLMPGGKINDIVLGFEKMEDYFQETYLTSYPWFGAAVGRYGNRIKDAKFKLDGKEYQLSVNNGNDQLHGGVEGFDKKVWEVLDYTGTELRLKYVSADGEEGFPGRVDVNLQFILNENNELSYTLAARTTAPTPINLTHHSYFNLNNGEGSIANHELEIPASHYLEQDGNLVATGKLIRVEGTAHDFRKWKKIGEGGGNGPEFDQSFVLDHYDKNVRLVAALYAPQSGLKLEVHSDQPVVHFYSGKWIPKIKGKNQVLYKPFSALCLETQIHPNAVNIPQFPNTILKPGEEYSQKTVYRVTLGK